jgi:hypothetical protein
MRGLCVAGALAGLVALGACAPVPVPSGPPAPDGTALANCERELRFRGGGVTRIIRVDIFEAQRGIITAAGSFGTNYTCFTNQRGEVVNITVDRRYRL